MIFFLCISIWILYYNLRQFELSFTVPHYQFIWFGHICIILYLFFFRSFAFFIFSFCCLFSFIFISNNAYWFQIQNNSIYLLFKLYHRFIARWTHGNITEILEKLTQKKGTIKTSKSKWKEKYKNKNIFSQKYCTLGILCGWHIFLCASSTHSTSYTTIFQWLFRISSCVKPFKFYLMCMRKHYKHTIITILYMWFTQKKMI